MYVLLVYVRIDDWRNLRVTVVQLTGSTLGLLGQTQNRCTGQVHLFGQGVSRDGLCNVPATMKILVERILAHIPWNRCMVYLDDLLAHKTDFQLDLENLRQTFQTIQGETCA